MQRCWQQLLLLAKFLIEKTSATAAETAAAATALTEAEATVCGSAGRNVNVSLMARATCVAPTRLLQTTWLHKQSTSTAATGSSSGNWQHVLQQLRNAFPIRQNKRTIFRSWKIFNGASFRLKIAFARVAAAVAAADGHQLHN